MESAAIRLLGATARLRFGGRHGRAVDNPAFDHYAHAIEVRFVNLKIDIRALMGEKQVLSGSADGRRLLAGLVTATPVDAPHAVFLDFSGIEVATVSFLREGVVAYRDFVRASRQGICPVIANASPAVVEELEFFLEARSDAMWSCRLDGRGEVADHRILGQLDPVQKKTFDLVMRLGNASAPELAAGSPSENIGTTAWNNRLSALVAKGLLVEERRGKVKFFKSLLGHSSHS